MHKPILSIRLRISLGHKSTDITIEAVYLKNMTFLLYDVDTTRIKTGKKLSFLIKVLTE